MSCGGGKGFGHGTHQVRPSGFGVLVSLHNQQMNGYSTTKAEVLHVKLLVFLGE